MSGPCAHQLALAAAALALLSAGRAFAEDSAAPASAWTLRVSGEAGIGTRHFELPMEGVVYRTSTDVFPAYGLGFELDHATSRAVRVGLHARYQSSINHGIVEQHTDGSLHAVDVRAHRIELSFVPSFRLDDAGEWVLSIAAGCGFRGFRPVAHLVTPGYTLAGPQLRPELRLPIVGPLGLRLGPEAQWIVHVGSELEERGVASTGFGVGGQAALELALGRWTLAASYRELHSLADSAQGQSFQDVERFLTARIAGAL